MKIWHVYIDDNFRSSFRAYYDDIDGLPFASDFQNMKLFRSKQAALEYAQKELNRFRREWSKLYNVTDSCLESRDGGEFVVGINAMNYNVVAKTVKFKGVLRELQ